MVATPIGNLGDLGARALAVLAGVDRVLCEDTRHSSRLFEHFGIATPLTAFHDHNEKQQAARSIDDIVGRGEAWALVSDAGTPLISDPGYALLAHAADAGLRVIPVPGPSAVTAALSISGLATDRFLFEGFLPAQPAARQRRLAALAKEARTSVLYEAPHRIGKLLEAMREAFGDARRIVIAREMTKRFETVYRGTASELLSALAGDSNLGRGELVVMVAGAAERSADEAALDHTLDVLLSETDSRTALRLAIALTGLPRNTVYRRLLARGDE